MAGPLVTSARRSEVARHPRPNYASRNRRGGGDFSLLFTPVEHWRRAPLALQAYVAINVTASPVLAVLQSPVRLIGLPIALLFAYFLLRQNRIAWFLAIASQIIAAPNYIIDHDMRIYLVWVGVDLILLLAPATRRFFSRESAGATADAQPKPAPPRSPTEELRAD